MLRITRMPAWIEEKVAIAVDSSELSMNGSVSNKDPRLNTQREKGNQQGEARTMKPSDWQTTWKLAMLSMEMSANTKP